jgi:lipopolysaccharide biosynthesis glycosyltransferase
MEGLAPAADMVPLVFCFDKNFAPYAGASIASALANSDAFYKIYCIFSSPEEDFPQSIVALCNRHRCELIKIPISIESFADWRLDPNSHFSAAAYYRLLIPQLIPEKRAVYLDCDLIVTCGLARLHSQDLAGAWIAGCVDPVAAPLSHIPRADGDPYLNSGVLLLDLETLRSVLPSSEIARIYSENEQLIVFPDQCLINKMAEGKKLAISESWNLQFHNRSREELSELIDKNDGSAILHFSGPLKPWMAWAPSRYTAFWSQYARLAGIDCATAIRQPSTLRERIMMAARYESEQQWEAASKLWQELTFALINEFQKATQPG